MSLLGSVHAIEPRSGMPLLHFACEHQNLEMIQALVKHGADIDCFIECPRL